MNPYREKIFYEIFLVFGLIVVAAGMLIGLFHDQIAENFEDSPFYLYAMEGKTYDQIPHSPRY